jgi:hypothetical protein
MDRKEINLTLKIYIEYAASASYYQPPGVRYQPKYIADVLSTASQKG